MVVSEGTVPHDGEGTGTAEQLRDNELYEVTPYMVVNTEDSLEPEMGYNLQGPPLVTPALSYIPRVPKPPNCQKLGGQVFKHKNL